MISKDKTYRTSGGRDVVIYATDMGGNYPVHGAISVDGTWHLVKWTEGGRYYGDNDPNPRDLVEVKPRFRVEYWANIYRDKEGRPYIGSLDTNAPSRKYDWAGTSQIATKRIIITGQEGDVE